MNKFKAVGLAALLAVAGLSSAFAAGNPNGPADIDWVDQGWLLSAQLGMVMQPNPTYLQHAFGDGWSPNQITATRIGNSPQAYAQFRLKELHAGDSPESQWLASHLEKCLTKDCIFDYAIRETLGMALQAAHMPQVPTAQQVQNPLFLSKWAAQVVYHATAANKAEAAIGKAFKRTWTAPLRDAEFKQLSLGLLKQFYEMPFDDIFVEFDKDARGDLRAHGHGYSFEYAGKNYAVTTIGTGIYTTQPFSVSFGGGCADGLRYSYPRLASGRFRTSNTAFKDGRGCQ
jgi:hypothetical protein